MRVLPALSFISALTPGAYTFEFTSPDTSKPVNLSEPVVFKWPLATGKPTEPWLQIIFATGDLSQWSRWAVHPNQIDITNVSTWTWDSPKWIEEVNADGVKQILLKGENNWFEAAFSDDPAVSTWENPVKTEKFEIVGYPNLGDPNSEDSIYAEDPADSGDSGAGVITPSPSLVLAAGSLALILSLTTWKM
ncbi:hypothetical protein EDB81DRAFT_799373 [Dactylonectria macrodidyma]|uniref:Uncharacterized protein n=1 Tax=Dactylonectria macrodidyma TaxID=307937 RepID=A0A9P9ENV7_9HYPO|nr:hypothetical protein EDB81DRAFT_799373 [Dactylonectria macrodidyma]